MAKRIIRFPLKMRNGTEVRTIEELRENFDIDSVLEYFTNGKLTVWLNNRYYDEIANAISCISVDSDNICQELCQALGVKYQEASKSISDIQADQEKLKRYRELMGDETYADKISNVAFDQKDLDELVAKGEKEIYLFKGEFTIDLSKTDIEYTGIDNPKIDGNNMDILNPFPMKNIKNMDAVKVGSKVVMMPEKADDIYKLALRYKDIDNNTTYILFRKAAENDHRDAMYSLAYCYEHGRGIEENKHIAAKWYKKAHEKGHPFAKMDLVRLSDEDNVSTAQQALNDIDFKKIIEKNENTENNKVDDLRDSIERFMSKSNKNDNFNFSTEDFKKNLAFVEEHLRSLKGGK